MSISKNAVEVLCGEFSFNLRGEFESKVVEITPETAIKLLSFSEGNRALKNLSLTLLVKSIKENYFVVTNNAISFDENFILRDGHHRLKAISMAGITVKHAVSINIPFQNFQHVDRGVTRSQSDIISIYGAHKFDFQVTPHVIAIATSLINCFSNVCGSTRNPNDVEKAIHANRNGINFVVDNFKCGQRGLSSGVLKAAIVAAFESSVPCDKLILFCMMLSQGVSSGIKSESNAALFCRDALIGNRLNDSLSKLGYSGIAKGGSKGSSARIVVYFIQYCIQQFMAGKDVNRVATGALMNKETKEITLSPVIYAPISVI